VRSGFGAIIDIDFYKFEYLQSSAAAQVDWFGSREDRFALFVYKDFKYSTRSDFSCSVRLRLNRVL
jgi:hypothetical protein